jgi:hypothetical protein
VLQSSGNNSLNVDWQTSGTGVTSYEWDEEKALANGRKHGISFEEASTIFEGRGPAIGA